MLVLILVVVVSLVITFIRHLPAAPRYDALTIDPGSRIPARRAFGMQLEIGEGDAMVTRSWRASTLQVLGEPPVPEVLARDLEVGDSWRLVAGLSVELSETTIVGFLIEMGDVEFVIRSAHSEIASGRVEAMEWRRVDDFLVPAGSRLLEFEIRPIGPAPLFRGFWIDEDDVQRPIGDLSGTPSQASP